MKETFRQYFLELLLDIAQTDTQIVLLAVLLVVIVIVLDAVSSFAKNKRRQTGLEDQVKKADVSNSSSQSLPLKNYVSDIQGLSGKPDALVSENGFIIPVERKPLARKIRDRYVAQLLVYMRLVEEFEGKKPPYGYLVLGPNCRRVKIDNSLQRQTWLQKYIDEIRATLERGEPVTPAPHPRKCEKCTVRNHCQFKIVDNPITGKAHTTQTD